MERLKSSFKKFTGRYGDVIQQYEVSLSHVKWHSDPWPVTVTSQPPRLSTNFITLIPGLTFTELRVVSMEHLQQVLLASRERLPFRTPGSVPLVGTSLCSNCWDQFYRTYRNFSRPFTLNTPQYFLDFAFKTNKKRVQRYYLLQSNLQIQR